MTDKLAAAFDAALQQTALDVSAIGATKQRMTTVLAAMLKAEYPTAPDLSIIAAATSGIDMFIAEMQDAAELKGMDAARFGRALAGSDSLQTSIVNHCHDRVKRLAISIRAERAANDGITRANDAYKEGIALPDGKTYPAH